MTISADEAGKRKAVIDALEQHASRLQREIYDRKANLLLSFYEFEMIECDKSVYTGHIFRRGRTSFLDIDDALEFAEAQ